MLIEEDITSATWREVSDEPITLKSLKVRPPSLSSRPGIQHPMTDPLASPFPPETASDEAEAKNRMSEGCGIGRSNEHVLFDEHPPLALQSRGSLLAPQRARWGSSAEALKGRTDVHHTEKER